MNLYKREKFADLYVTKDWSDCVFYVDDEKILAHKFLLACSSPVFESMFYGSLATNEVTIDEIEPHVFKKMLAYIYTDQIRIDSVIEAWNLVYVCQKYFLAELEKICVDFIRKNLKMSNLIMCFECASLYNKSALGESCLDDIVTFARGILLFSEYHMSVDTLRAILKVQKGNRADLLMLAVNWALEQCTMESLSPSESNLLQIFNKYQLFSEFKIRKFHVKYSEGMFKSLNNDQIFLFENVAELSKKICYSYLEPLNYFSSDYLEAKTPHFSFRGEYKNSQCIRILTNEQITPCINCTRDILLFGVAVSTKSKYMHSNIEDYMGSANVYIYSKLNENVSHLIYKHSANDSLLRYDDIQKIVFPLPVLLEANKDYTICVEYIANPAFDEQILLKFLSDMVYKGKVDTSVIRFKDESNGSVLRGICYYEA